MQISLKELQAQVALGTITEDIRAEIFVLSESEALKVLSTCADVSIRRAVALNPHTPYSVLRSYYRGDPDLVVKELAWDQIASKYRRKFNQEPPRSPLKEDPKNLPPGTLIYRS